MKLTHPMLDLLRLMKEIPVATIRSGWSHSFEIRRASRDSNVIHCHRRVRDALIRRGLIEKTGDSYSITPLGLRELDER